jgi:hypothetical protein
MIDLFWEEADLPSKSLLAIIGAPETTLHIVALRQPDAQLRLSFRRKEKAPAGDSTDSENKRNRAPARSRCANQGFLTRANLHTPSRSPKARRKILLNQIETRAK